MRIGAVLETREKGGGMENRIGTLIVERNAALRTLIEQFEPHVNVTTYKTRLVVKEKGEYFFVAVEEI